MPYGITQSYLAMWASASLLRRFTDTNVYTEPVPLKYRKLASKYPGIYGCFYSVECGPRRLVTARRVGSYRLHGN